MERSWTDVVASFEPDTLRHYKGPGMSTIPQDRLTRLLIVEDDEAQLRTVADIMQDEGFVVTPVSTAEQALEYLRRHVVEVAILDYRLPDMTGVELLEKIHQSDSSVRVILHTAFGTYDSARDAVNLGAFAYVEKMRDPTGLVSKAHLAARDYIERYARDLEQAVSQRTTQLQESEERFRQLAETIDGVFWLIDYETEKLIYVSSAFEKHWGTSPETLYQDAWSWTRAIHDEDRERVIDAAKAQLAGDGEYHQEYRIITPQGVERWVQDRRYPIRDDLGNVYRVAGITEDISQRKHAECEREHLIAELEVKQAEMEQFTYTVSHDLKSPLITINGFVGMIENHVQSKDWETLSRDLDRIRLASSKMQALLADLLELSRVGRRERLHETVSLNKVVDEAVQLVSVQIAEREVVVDVADNLPAVLGEHQRLQEVFQNLIDNAVKFMGDQPSPRIEIGMRNDEEGTVFFVRDNGPGIDPTYQQRIFGLFERLDFAVEGTGVGLALVKRIVERHGGRIWVESDGDGNGTTFCFTLALAEAVKV